MRFELKTDNQIISSRFTSIAFMSGLFFFISVLTSLSFHISKISNFFEIEYLCKLFLVEKSSFNFNKLSKLTNQTSKQKMWDLCKEISK
tara:strand:+ start:5593 stop:5859 length:267 start_codon:yes stop_codon:yes gene_type:complete